MVFAHLQSETAQNPAQAVLDVEQLRLQQFAAAQDRARFLCLDRLAVHRSEPAEPHQLGDCASVVAIRLHRHRLESVPHVPCLQQFDRKSRLAHGRAQPLRQGTSLQSDPLDRQPVRSEPGDQRFRLARNLALAHNLSLRHPQRTRSSIPKTRRFRHNSSWSSLDDAWSGLALSSLFDTINLRDDRLPAKQAARMRAIQQRRSVRAACLDRPARYPIYEGRAGCLTIEQ